MKTPLSTTIRRSLRFTFDEACSFMLAFTVLAPWTAIEYTKDTVFVVLDTVEEHSATEAYASSYSEVTSTVTSNGRTVSRSASDSGDTSSSVSITNSVQNGKNGADGKDGADGEDGTNGMDGQDGKNGQDGVKGVELSHDKVATMDIGRLERLKLLLEQLFELLMKVRTGI